LDAPIPVALTPLLEMRSAQRLAEQGLKIILSESDINRPEGHFRRWHSLRYRSSLKASWRFKLAEFSQLWIIEDDWEDISLPDWMFPLYFVSRPFLWLRRYHLPLSQRD
jgi:hypothetical protein